MSKLSIIIVAAGSGARMNSTIPKQFLPLLGIPILVRSIQSIHSMLPMAEITIVLSKDDIERWSRISEEHDIGSIHNVCIGGATRFDSVGSALSSINGCDYIAVHDGVRPLFTQDMIDRSLECVKLNGSAIPAIDVIDSFRVVDKEGNSNVIDRSTLKAIQTPQWFDASILKSSYSVNYRENFTDDASVVEYSGHKVTICQGDIQNIKITTPTDIIIAEELLRSRGL